MRGARAVRRFPGRAVHLPSDRRLLRRSSRAPRLGTTLFICAHAVIPGTNIPDNPQNRAVLQVLADYKQAMEARDPNALLALAAPDYFDRANSSRPNEPRDLEGLRRTLPKDFNGVRALKLDIDIRNLTIKGDRAQVDYFAVMR